MARPPAGDGAHQSPPIVNDGVTFVSTPDNQVIAFLRQPLVLWRYRRPRPAGAIVIHQPNRGVALCEDKVFYRLDGADRLVVRVTADPGPSRGRGRAYSSRNADGTDRWRWQGVVPLPRQNGVYQDRTKVLFVSTAALGLELATVRIVIPPPEILGARSDSADGRLWG